MGRCKICYEELLYNDERLTGHLRKHSITLAQYAENYLDKSLPVKQPAAGGSESKEMQSAALKWSDDAKTVVQEKPAVNGMESTFVGEISINKAETSSVNSSIDALS